MADKASEPIKMTAKDILEMHIANCVCCTLADAMKGCATCPFNVGLDARAAKIAELAALKGN